LKFSGEDTPSRPWQRGQNPRAAARTGLKLLPQRSQLNISVPFPKSNRYNRIGDLFPLAHVDKPAVAVAPLRRVRNARS
jgi:hypothetical protein